MRVEDLIVMFDERMALQRRHGLVCLLFDALEMDSIPAESRRYAIRFKPDPPIRGAVVVVGAGPVARTALSLITTAARLLGQQNEGKMFFADDKAEAWAILARERLALSAGQPPA